MKRGMGNRAGAISSEPSPERASSSTARGSRGAEVEVGPGVGGTGQSRPPAARKSAAKAASALAAAMDRGEGHDPRRGERARGGKREISIRAASFSGERWQLFLFTHVCYTATVQDIPLPSWSLLSPSLPHPVFGFLPRPPIEITGKLECSASTSCGRLHDLQSPSSSASELSCQISKRKLHLRVPQRVSRMPSCRVESLKSPENSKGQPHRSSTFRLPTTQRQRAPRTASPLAAYDGSPGLAKPHKSAQCMLQVCGKERLPAGEPCTLQLQIRASTGGDIISWRSNSAQDVWLAFSA